MALAEREGMIMAEPLSFMEGLMTRVNGPMNFRFILQPVMAIIFAFIDGRKDAKTGKPAYFWALFTNSDHRREMLKSGWKSISKVFVFAIILDIVFQFVKFHAVSSVLGALIAGVILAILPYLIVRGPVNRLMTCKTKEEKK